MTTLLADEPVLTLFLVAALGSLLGRVRIGGVGLGVAAVVFAGLGVSAVFPEAALPEFVVVLGLAIFVYAVGLASGPSLRHVLRGGGGRVVAGAAAVLVVTAAAVVGLAAVLGVDGAGAAGAFAGALTNTPTLATVVDAVGGTAGDAAVVAFSITYPLGMAVTLVATARAVRGAGANADDLHRVTVVVGQDVGDVAGLLGPQAGQVTVVRVRRGVDAVAPDDDVVATTDTRLEVGWTVTLLGSHEAVETVAGRAGGPRRADAFEDRRALDFRSVWVTERGVVGRTIGDLHLQERRGATITRVARGDVEWLASDEDLLQLGDRVTLVAPTDRLEAVADELGDEVRRTSEIDVLTFGLGVVLGILLGTVPVPLGPVTLQLGFAGGPLVAGLVLGALVRTGPLLWQVPQSASVTLRQLGLVLFLAGVGTRAGPAFVDALGSPLLLQVLALGAVAIAVPVAATLVLRDRALGGLGAVGDTPSALAGLVAGITSQPAALALAEDRAAGQDALLGYATVFPVAMVGKILLGQAVAAVLG